MHSREYRPDIDGLRAVAVATVVIFHAFPELLPGGFVGVDVFFVISGFLISSIIINGTRLGQFTLVDFYRRRIKRILPALLVVLVVTAVIGWFVLLSREYRTMGKHLIGAATFSSNFLLWMESDYFNATAATKQLLHLWSLGIEEQYYLAWPILCSIIVRRRALALPVTASLLLISFASNIAFVQTDAVAAFYSPGTRVWELLAGSLLAIWAARSAEAPAWGPRLWDIASCAGMALIIAGTLFTRESGAFPGWWAVLPVLGTCLLISAGPAAVCNRILLARPALVWIGLISYPLYLWHWPLLSFLYVTESGTSTPLMRGVAVALSVLLAWATFVWIEKPIRFRPRRWVATGLVGGLAVVGGLGYYIYRADGFRHRFPEAEALIDTILARRDSIDGCLVRLAGLQPRYCLMTDASRPATVALVGDSHSNLLFPPLSTRLAALGHNLIQLGVGGCPPFWNIEAAVGGQRNDCVTQMTPLLDYVLKTREITTVVLSHRGAVHLTGTDLASPRQVFELVDPSNSGHTGRRAIYEAAFRDALRRFHQAGKRVVVVLDPPELPFVPLGCVRDTFGHPPRFASSGRNICPTVSRVSVQQREAVYREVTARITSEFQLSTVDLGAPLCDEKECRVVIDSQLLYRDSDHLSPAGAEYVVDRTWTEFGFAPLVPRAPQRAETGR